MGNDIKQERWYAGVCQMRGDLCAHGSGTQYSGVFHGNHAPLMILNEHSFSKLLEPLKLRPPPGRTTARARLVARPGLTQLPGWPVKAVLSIWFGLPSTTKRMLRMYFCATRCTSAGVTARSFSRNRSELRQPPPINSYWASSDAWAAFFSGFCCKL